VKVMGLDCQKQGIEARRKMSYMPGELRLYEDATGSDLIEIGSSSDVGKITEVVPAPGSSSRKTLDFFLNPDV